MKKNPLFEITIFAVVLLILSSLTNVVGLQTVQLSKQKIINKEIDQKELLFRTIVDIANNKEIQKILQNPEIKKSLENSLKTSGIKLLFFNQIMRFHMLLPPPKILTKTYLMYAYNMGVRLAKNLDTSKIHSLLEQHRTSNQEMQKEITKVIENNPQLHERISSLHCNCEDNNTTRWSFPILCTLLVPFLAISFGLYFMLDIIIFLQIMEIIGLVLNCIWT